MFEASYMGESGEGDVEVHSLDLGMVGEKVLTFTVSQNLGGELPVLASEDVS